MVRDCLPCAENGKIPGYIYAVFILMTAAQSLKIYEILNRQFGKPDEARQVVEAIEAVVSEKVDEGNRRYEALLHKDMEILRLEAKETAQTLRTEMQTLRTEMKEQKSELIKWMFIFWIGQIAATIGIILLFVRK